MYFIVSKTKSICRCWDRFTLGKTPIIKDQKLIIEPNEWFAEIRNNYPALEKEYLRLEPTKMPMNKAKIGAIASIRAQWLAWLDSFRTFEWGEVLPVLDLALSQVRQLLAIILILLGR